MSIRDIVISGSFNSRDLGGYQTQQGNLAWKKTFRSGNMVNVDQEGIATLKQLGVNRVIDLRSQKERQAEPDPFRLDYGIELIAISLFDELNPKQQPQGFSLLELYLHALETHGEAFVEVLRKIADCEKAVLFHCTAGKDRTGLIAALLLSLSGVNRDDIIQDYAMTAMRIGPLLQNIEKTAAALKLDKVDFAPMLECKPETMQKTLEWLDDKFDGSENYVREHGLTDRELQLLRGRWLAS